ncbi:MAG TPA: DNA-binding protein [Phycisphaerales bacterium]|nr:DNA-binding protein [Phycisphaerales bacterium]
MPNEPQIILRAIGRLEQRLNEIEPRPARLLTIEQAANYLAMSTDTIRRMCARRQLTYVQTQPGAAMRIPLEALDRWIDSNSTRPLAH